MDIPIQPLDAAWRRYRAALIAAQLDSGHAVPDLAVARELREARAEFERLFCGGEAA